MTSVEHVHLSHPSCHPYDHSRILFQEKFKLNHSQSSGVPISIQAVNPYEQCWIIQVSSFPRRVVNILFFQVQTSESKRSGGYYFAGPRCQLVRSSVGYYHLEVQFFIPKKSGEYFVLSSPSFQIFGSWTVKRRWPRECFRCTRWFWSIQRRFNFRGPFRIPFLTVYGPFLRAPTGQLLRWYCFQFTWIYCLCFQSARPCGQHWKWKQ